MTRRAPELPWRILLISTALAAATLALFLHLFELRSRQQEVRRAADRLERAVAEARVQLREELLAELRAGDARAEPDEEPRAGTVLRRREPAQDARSGLGQSSDPLGRGGAPSLDALARRVAGLAQRTEEAELALRRDLEDLRAATESQADVAREVTTLSLIALLALAGALLLPVPRRDGPQEGIIQAP